MGSILRPTLSWQPAELVASSRIPRQCDRRWVLQPRWPPRLWQKALLEVNHSYRVITLDSNCWRISISTLWNLFSCKPCRRKPSLSRLTEWNWKVGAKIRNLLATCWDRRVAGFYNDVYRSLGSGSPKCSRTSRPIIRALAKQSSPGAYGLLCGSLGAKGLNRLSVQTPELSHHLLYCFLRSSHHRKPLSAMSCMYIRIYTIHTWLAY